MVMREADLDSSDAIGGILLVDEWLIQWFCLSNKHFCPTSFGEVTVEVWPPKSGLSAGHSWKIKANQIPR